MSFIKGTSICSDQCTRSAECAYPILVSRHSQVHHVELLVGSASEKGIAHEFALLRGRDHGIAVVERRVMVAVIAEREIDTRTARVFEIGKEIPLLCMEKSAAEQGQH